ncbi:uncharacterized protein PODANS_2_6910 [Podospora anserina S mat+]|uniref:Podospora anserina S mat+ genomic DNA chromosome 2, supercontig 2 n=1 Tax=Podospora anserina (strain S / ATCC MYA-4624 / DSM 980 / FGSC 10383) TaxID=515849 RepID=B2B670_PODAN|nr:uncharacterized protein PODANS_2_6910 [Podospora anserina S mat+]CAP73295.1 unnamed protein product [Podospora anserina S mat+]CDP25698.1 Putative protein similar to C1002.18 of Schizosaccharomyces pombe [Podospora anserina S mat+]
MGLFSRRDKAPKAAADDQPALASSQSKTSLTSASSSIVTPINTSSRIINRTSAGTTSTAGPGTPLTPFSPTGMNPTLPKVDMPRPPDPQLDPAGYLRSLSAVRERCQILWSKALKNDLRHFDVDMRKFPDVVSFVANIIKRDYDAPFTTIPPHGRYQHFGVGGRDRIAHLLATWPEDMVDNTEKCKRMIDLFLVSVLLDAGAGTKWSYKSVENGRVYRRSEGIAVATLDMFKTGLFSGSPANKYQVDKEGLRQLTVEKLAQGLQSTPGNEMAGLEGRAQLLIRLSEALNNTEYFGEDGRPGNMLDHILSHPSTQASSVIIVPLTVLWNVLIDGLAPIWPPSRTAINGVSLGDAWPCSSMPQPAQSPTSPTFSPFPNTTGQSNGIAPWESILPFHKLTQWLTYSLMQPMQSIMKIQFAGQELLTGLPEYRNGGLFIDMGVMTLKPEDQERGLQHYAEYCQRTGTKAVEVAPMFEPSDDVIVEWRGATVGFLDMLALEVNRVLKAELAGGELSLAQVLEAGSWKGGREIAEVSRPNTKEPPILIDSDGTVF